MVFKSGFVTVLGRPNVGKSTLINNLIKEKVAITSPKPQTTRNRIRAIYTIPEGQIIFVDTPGIHKSRNELDKYMLKQALNSLEGIDLALLLVDGTSPFGKGDDFIVRQLKGINIPIIVAMNKIDKINQKVLLDRMDEYNKKIGKEVIPISAREGKNMDTLVERILENLPEGPQYYPENMITDQIEQFVIAEIIREKIFYLAREEVPYGIAVLVDEMEERENGYIFIRATIFVEKTSHKGIIIGKNGSMLKEIGKKARKDIEGLLQANVFLDLWVKVLKDWREKEGLIKRMGYKE